MWGSFDTTSFLNILPLGIIVPCLTTFAPMPLFRMASCTLKVLRSYKETIPCEKVHNRSPVTTKSRQIGFFLKHTVMRGPQSFHGIKPS
ncbi:hypothetical protein BJV78DRAFT_1204292 [Lactifluus subvellereus]|nr:hypothetical protein BJV78DRAFT_1204292 [Lactifluus subvellereus]